MQFNLNLSKFKYIKSLSLLKIQSLFSLAYSIKSISDICGCRSFIKTISKPSFFKKFHTGDGILLSIKNLSMGNFKRWCNYLYRRNQIIGVINASFYIPFFKFWMKFNYFIKAITLTQISQYLLNTNSSAINPRFP